MDNKTMQTYCAFIKALKEKGEIIFDAALLIAFPFKDFSL
jgi:hypothetical protein